MKELQSARLNKSLSKVPKWADDRRPLSDDDLQSYIEGDPEVDAGLVCFELFDYGMLAVSQSLLAAHDKRATEANRLMSFGIKRMLYADMITLKKVQVTRTGGFVGTLDGCTHLMLGAIALGQPQLVAPFYQEVLDGVEGGYGAGDGHKPPVSSTLRYAAFGLSIISEWLGNPLDLDKHALPRDPAWGQLVAHWREPAPEKLLPVLLAACDVHIERMAVTDREASQDKKYEFSSTFLAVHPTEILAVLRLRDLLGLPNPTQIDHPLMQTPYAAITCRPGEVTENDELLDRYLAAMRQHDPHVLPPGL
ncbi:hypothetical protein PSEWESI4_04726 [Pseudomonas carbonaria]|uniref:Uncharacterized protein n=2 Tax=Zestomonas carbonaria TaxID=2762745 RepID=A0A7U7ESL7_9GAMM|nr:hypothetical protein PSEWESI4_04726 [Pseudomonas carbonaria]